MKRRLPRRALGALWVDHLELLRSPDTRFMATIPEYRALSPDALDALERAVRQHLRVALRRRGTEYVVVAERLETSGRDDVLAGRLPMTGELLTFRLRDLESFAVLP